VEAILALEKEISKIQHLEIEPQTKLVGEENKTRELEVDIKPLVPIQIEITKL
jgi:hypothetical protein